MKLFELLIFTILTSVSSLIFDPSFITKNQIVLNNINTNVDKNLLIGNMQNLNINIVDKITKTLPNIDSIGHQVILLDKSLVSLLIENHSISPDFKKEIILGIIKISQEGDQIGTFVLQTFYKISDFLL